MSEDLNPADLPELLPWEPAPTPRPEPLERVYQAAYRLAKLKAEQELLTARRAVYVKIWKANEEAKGRPWPPPGYDADGRRLEDT